MTVATTQPRIEQLLLIILTVFAPEQIDVSKTGNKRLPRHSTILSVYSLLPRLALFTGVRRMPPRLFLSRPSQISERLIDDDSFI